MSEPVWICWWDAPEGRPARDERSGTAIVGVAGPELAVDRFARACFRAGDPVRCDEIVWARLHGHPRTRRFHWSAAALAGTTCEEVRS